MPLERAQKTCVSESKSLIFCPETHTLSFARSLTDSLTHALSLSPVRAHAHAHIVELFLDDKSSF
jgi:hypothetical protein